MNSAFNVFSYAAIFRLSIPGAWAAILGLSKTRAIPQYPALLPSGGWTTNDVI